MINVSEYKCNLNSVEVLLLTACVVLCCVCVCVWCGGVGRRLPLQYLHSHKVKSTPKDLHFTPLGISSIQLGASC